MNWGSMKASSSLRILWVCGRAWRVAQRKNNDVTRRTRTDAAQDDDDGVTWGALTSSTSIVGVDGGVAGGVTAENKRRWHRFGAYGRFSKIATPVYRSVWRNHQRCLSRTQWRITKSSNRAPSTQSFHTSEFVKSRQAQHHQSNQYRLAVPNRPINPTSLLSWQNGTNFFREKWDIDLFIIWLPQAIV